jgi:hypothetical protein
VLLGVDCRSASACVAVDEAGDGFVGNAPPVCQAVQAATDENVAVQVSFSCSSSWGPNTYAVVTNPSHGTLSGLDATHGIVTYTPTAAYSGSDSFTYQATDSTGGSNTATVAITVVDTTAPSISIAAPANGAAYTQAQVVNASYSCTDPDGPTDVASCAGPVAAGSPIDTASLGAHTFTVLASDRAGNRVSQTVQYMVAASAHGGSPTPTVKTSRRPSTKRRGATILVDPGIRVTCPAGGETCTAEETVTVRVAASAARGKTKKIVIGRQRFTIPAGESKELTLRLNGKGARLLRKLNMLRVSFVVISRVDHNKPITTTKTITIKLPPRKHGKH